jgi:hypothetical protein
MTDSDDFRPCFHCNGPSALDPPFNKPLGCAYCHQYGPPYRIGWVWTVLSKRKLVLPDGQVLEPPPFDCARCKDTRVMKMHRMIFCDPRIVCKACGVNSCYPFIVMDVPCRFCRDDKLRDLANKFQALILALDPPLPPHTDLSVLYETKGVCPGNVPF